MIDKNPGSVVYIRIEPELPCIRGDCTNTASGGLVAYNKRANVWELLPLCPSCNVTIQQMLGEKPVGGEGDVREPIETWSTTDRFQFILSKSMLILNEQIDRSTTRATSLPLDDALDLLQFLIRFEKDIFERMEAPKPLPSVIARWNARQKKRGW